MKQITTTFLFSLLVASLTADNIHIHIHIKAHSFIPRTTTTTTASNHIDKDIDIGRNRNRNRNSNRQQLTEGVAKSYDDMIQIVPRGGSLTIDKEEEEETEISGSSNSFIVKKLRNIIRSILKSQEKKSPITTKVLKRMIKCVETMTGMELLPPRSSSSSLVAAGKKNKKKKQRNETSKKAARKEGGTTTTTATATQSKGKNKSNGKGENNAKKQQQAKKISGAAQSHLSKNIKTSNPNYRIQRELKEFLKSPPPNLSVKVGKNIRVWIITMVGTKGSLYEGEKYRLKVTFPSDYPTGPPSVYFLPPSPRHEHVYTNGDICLSLLGKDWRPTMTAQSIANSILSILSGASRKSLPMDNVAHAKEKPGKKQDDWIYHDDNC